MRPESEREFHLRRARQELDLAYRTDCRTAVEVHLRLSSLHMARLREASPSSGTAIPPGPEAGTPREPACLA